jgi:hypothetical protein
MPTIITRASASAYPYMGGGAGGPVTFNWLIVAGGGAGGGSYGQRPGPAGGGGGGVGVGSTTLNPGTVLSVTVGAGGTATTAYYLLAVIQKLPMAAVAAVFQPMLTHRPDKMAAQAAADRGFPVTMARQQKARGHFLHFTATMVVVAT